VDVRKRKSVTVKEKPEEEGKGISQKKREEKACSAGGGPGGVSVRANCTDCPGLLTLKRGAAASFPTFVKSAPRGIKAFHGEGPKGGKPIIENYYNLE